MQRKQKAAQVNANDNYNHFTGTDNYNRMGAYLITDGVRELCEDYSCYWFVDVIRSWQKYPRIRAKQFQVWTLERMTGNKFRAKATDGHGNKLAAQIIAFLDFRDDLLTFWLIDGVILLPSEY